MIRTPTLALCAILVGCATTATLRGSIAGSRMVTARARAAGAMACAPRELALAETHLDFAAAEVEQGDAARAREHLALAEPNAAAALRLSDPVRCTGDGLPPDGDHDGVADADDACADVPEDRDGVADSDGCPEVEDTDADSFADDVDLCPIEAEDEDGFLDLDGCPDVDDDVDGLLDSADRCPREAEDLDGFEDQDGCSEIDNDRDGFQDQEDRCPNEPGIADEQGCPRVYRDVVVTVSSIVIQQQVFFETDRAVIRAVSYPLLDSVAQVLRDFPGIAIEVQGHTDSRGDDAHNLALSQARADAVRAYLVQAGIDSSRIAARGYGETAPIESNATADGRASNRRVEFRRTDAPSPAAAPSSASAAP
jgi:OmpA-OmpF porin, OOP family